jgi:hypothetical protein
MEYFPAQAMLAEFKAGLESSRVPMMVKRD